MRTVAYARVSSNSEDQKVALDENQLPRLRAQNPDRVIVDVASGRDNDRPGYLELLDLVDRGAIDQVIVTRVDRLGRDMTEAMFFVRLAGTRNVTITTLDGGEMSCSSPTDFITSSMMAMLAEFESRMLSLRICRGYQERRLANKPARSRAPWGYRFNKDRSALELDPIEGPRAAAMVQTLRNCSWQCTTALRTYNYDHGYTPLKTVQSLKNWITNPVLRGGLGYHFDGAPKKKPDPNDRIKPIKRTYTYKFKETVWERHDPLITPEEWREIKGRFEANRRLWGRNASSTPRLLTGFCVCAVCNKRMSYRSGKWKPAIVCHNSLKCPRRYRAVAEQYIIDQINAALSQRAEEIATLVSPESPEIRKLRDEIANLEAMQDPDCEHAIGRKRNRLIALQPQSALNPTFVDALRDAAVWTHMDSPTLRQTYEQLLDRVEVTDQQTVQVFCHF